MFCRFVQTSRDEVIASLEQFKLRSFVAPVNNKLKNKEFAYLRNNLDFVQQLEGDKEPKPAKQDFSIHHMIPSNTIVDFYKNYFELLSQQSADMLQHKEIDWVKIVEIQEQTMLLIYADKLWKKIGARPVDSYLKNPNTGQEDFVRNWYRFPIRLIKKTNKKTINLTILNYMSSI